MSLVCMMRKMSPYVDGERKGYREGKVGEIKGDGEREGC